MKKLLALIFLFSCGYSIGQIDPLSIPYESYGKIEDSLKRASQPKSEWVILKSKRVGNLSLFEKAVELTEDEIESLKSVIEYDKHEVNTYPSNGEDVKIDKSKAYAIQVEHVVENYYRVNISYFNGSFHYILAKKNGVFSVIKSTELVY